MSDTIHDAMRAAGLTPPEHIEPGKLHRFPGIGKGRGNTSGWARLFADGQGGVYGDWSTDLSETWQAKRERPFTPEERAEFAKQVREARVSALREQERQHQAAAIKTKKILQVATGDPTGHTYVIAKGGLPLGPLVKRGAWSQRDWSDSLLIPLFDKTGKITTISAISNDGEKDLLAGGQKRGCFHPMGKIRGATGQVLITEGIATLAAAVHSTGMPGVMAVDAGNLEPVARIVRELAPEAEIIIIGDDDRKEAGSNPGKTAATKAALAVGAKVAIPDLGRKADMWDLWRESGPEAVTACIEAAQPISTGDDGGTGDVPINTGVEVSPGENDEPGTLGTSGFQVAESGVYFRSDDQEEAPLWICSRLDVSAMTRDQDGEAWGRLLEFRDPDGRLHRWACPLELLAGDGGEFRRVLLSLGLQVSPGQKARQLLASYVQTWRVKDRATCTDKAGWHGPAYVLADETFGTQGERVLLQTIGEPPRLRLAGTVAEWRDNVARFCIGNSRLTLSVSMGFAAPLLELAGDESGGVHFTGGSSSGKTTCLRVGSSTWGGAEHLQRWRATSNGVEALAQAHNDGLFVLDELAQVDPREAGEIAYMLANGKGKARARRDGLARKAATWRLLFLSAGEIGLADHMQAAGKTIRAGQEVRLADVPADAGKGHGIFETLHGFNSGAALAEHLNAVVGNFHGAAIREYLRQLMQAPREQLREGINKLREDFLVNHVPPGADGQARRVAFRFALIAAGGEIATRFGLTGWAVGEAVAGAAVCFRAWLDRRGGAGSQEISVALAQVRHFLEAHGESRFSDLDRPTDRPTINRAGYRRRTDTGKLEYLVLPEAFKRELCAGLDYRSVARALRDQGLLRTESPDRLTIKPRDLGRVYCVREGIDDEG